MEIKLLIDFCKAVRGSTIKRLKMVPEDYKNRKVGPGALNFTDKLIMKFIIAVRYRLISGY